MIQHYTPDFTTLCLVLTKSYVRHCICLSVCLFCCTHALFHPNSFHRLFWVKCFFLSFWWDFHTSCRGGLTVRFSSVFWRKWGYVKDIEIRYFWPHLTWLVVDNGTLHWYRETAHLRYVVELALEAKDLLVFMFQNWCYFPLAVTYRKHLLFQRLVVRTWYLLRTRGWDVLTTTSSLAVIHHNRLGSSTVMDANGKDSSELVPNSVSFCFAFFLHFNRFASPFV